MRLGVLDIEIARADTAGSFMKVAKRSRRKAAPGETLTETVPLPPVGTTVRVAARAIERGHATVFTPQSSLIVQAAPPGPANLAAELKGESVMLRWEGTVPTPPPAPSPSPKPSGSPGAAFAPGSPLGSATSSPVPFPPPPVFPSAEAPVPAPTEPPVPAPAVGSAMATVNPPRSPIPPLSASPAASPTPPPITRGFLVYRRADPGGPYGAPMRAQPLTVNAIDDRTVALGQRWCYVVSTVISTEPVVESARSNESCIDVRDIVPPAAPAGVAALGAPDGIEVTWSPSIEADLAFYRLYRQAGGGPRERVGEVKPPETSLRDADAVRGTTYLYTVTAVDSAGNESPPSAGASAARP